MYPCGVFVTLREFEEQGEGAISNVQQVCDLLAEVEATNGRFTLHYFIDDVSVVTVLRAQPATLPPAPPNPTPYLPVARARRRAPPCSTFSSSSQPSPVVKRVATRHRGRF